MNLIRECAECEILREKSAQAVRRREDEIAALKEQVALLRDALTELDMTGIRYNETPVATVGRMRGIAMKALEETK